MNEEEIMNQNKEPKLEIEVDGTELKTNEIESLDYEKNEQMEQNLMEQTTVPEESVVNHVEQTIVPEKAIVNQVEPKTVPEEVVVNHIEQTSVSERQVVVNQEQSQPMMFNNQNNLGYSFWAEQSGNSINQSHGNNNSEQGNNMNLNHQNNFGMPNNSTKEKEPSFLKSIGKAVAVGLVAGVGFCGVLFASDKLGILDKDEQQKATVGYEKTFPVTITSSENMIKAPSDLTKVVDQCMPSIVAITSTVTSTYSSFYGTYDQDSTGSGSGIILKISDKEVLIVTNNHVISGAKKIMVKFDGSESEKDMVEATVKGTDSARDLAVVLVKTKDIPQKVLSEIKEIELGDSNDAKVGEMAIAIGNSLGYGQSLTVGYISAKDRKVEVDKGTMTLLQTDAAINPGNSGGALLDVNGKLIGINSAKYADTSVEGMGFAIPISDAVSVINELMEKEILTEEEKGYLGITGKDITKEVQKQYPNFPVGVYVYEVSDDGAAKDAGIIVGDVIVGINDKEVLTIKELAEQINSYRVGTKLTLKVLRYDKGKYKEKKVEVTLKGKKTLDSLESAENNSDENQNSQGNMNPNSGNQNSQGNTNPNKGNDYPNNDNQNNPYSGDNDDSVSPYGFDDNQLEEFYRYFYGY